MAHRHRPAQPRPTHRDYLNKRTSAGKSKTEALRCLTRYLARDVCNALPRPALALTWEHRLPRARLRVLRRPEQASPLVHYCDQLVKDGVPLNEARRRALDVFATPPRDGKPPEHPCCRTVSEL